MAEKKGLFTADSPLIKDVRRLIEEARTKVASTVNAALTMLYWRVGKRIDQEILKEDRGGIRRTNCARTECTIAAGIWPWVYQTQSFQHDTICPGASG
jgi:hypothetical protein